MLSWEPDKSTNLSLCLSSSLALSCWPSIFLKIMMSSSLSFMVLCRSSFLFSREYMLSSWLNSRSLTRFTSTFKMLFSTMVSWWGAWEVSAHVCSAWGRWGFKIANMLFFYITSTSLEPSTQWHECDTCSVQTSLFSSFWLVSQISISSSTVLLRSLLWVSAFSILVLRLRISSCPQRRLSV